MSRPIYRPRAIKNRLTNGELAALEDAIIAELEVENPQTVRHTFYRLCHLDAVGKTESGYRRIQRLILKLRKDGRLPYRWVSDGTRYRIAPNTFGSVSEALNDTTRLYRKALWRDASVYVEVWCESDSIAGVLEPVTNRYDVSLMSSRGFSSHTFLYRAAVEIDQIGKRTQILYVGDYDPSGKLIGEHIEKRLRGFAPNIEIEFKRLLINRDQIEEYDLPSKPPKRTTHSARFDDNRTVEAEAMAAGVTREILEAAILEHIDKHEIAVIETAERDERRALQMFSLDWLKENGGTLRW